MNKIINNRAIKDVASNNIGNFVYLGVQWLISILLVRLNNFESAGYFSLAMTIGTIFSMISYLSIRTFQVSNTDTNYSNELYVVLRLVTTILSIVLCIIYLFCFNYDKYSIKVVFFYMLFKCVEALGDVFGGIFQIHDEIVLASFSLVLKGILNLVFFIISFVLYKDLLLSMFLMFMSSLIVLLLYDIKKTKKYYHLSLERMDFNKVVNLGKIGIRMTLYSLFIYLLTSIPKLYVESIYGEHILGIYSSLFSLTIIITTFSNCVLLPFSPRVAEFYKNGNVKQLLLFLLKCNASFLFVAIVFYIFSITFGENVFVLLFGNEIIDYYSIFYYAILSSFLISIINSFGTFFMSINRIRGPIVSSILCCTILLVISKSMMLKYELFGAVYALLVALFLLIVAMIINMLFLLRKKSSNNC